MNSFGKTDIGLKRARNEDSFFVSDGRVGALSDLYIVADGMGGHKAGDVASSLAVERFVQYVSERDDADEKLDLLISAVNYANSEVYKLASSSEEYSNMGSTLIGCTVAEDYAYIAHVGDSRVYKLSGDKLHQLTNDHSYVAELVRAGRLTPEEAIDHPQRSVITRAIGTDVSVVADGLLVPVRKGDLLLMCTDGLNTMVKDHAIEGVLKNSELTIEEKVNCLIDMANVEGGYDNITVVLISV